MRILCRTDASVAIGSGHVMRCAALAQRLAGAGHDVGFLCREAAGDLTQWLAAQGFPVLSLAAADGRPPSEAEDAAACLGAIGDTRCDWLIVDHYGLGRGWETAMAPAAARLMAIDDLGRAHACDLLLDQNVANPAQARYRGCGEALLGPQYALLRPEFASLRPAALTRRREGLSRLIVCMGGSDPLNETGKALDGIARAGLAGRVRVDVVIGAGNPHRAAVADACARLGGGAELHVQTERMAELMAAADCAIGAGGNATWERCTLGLPALVTILAENQAPVAERLHAAGAHRLVGWHHALAPDDYAAALAALDPAALPQISARAAAICDGGGTDRVMQRLTGAIISSGLCAVK